MIQAIEKRRSIRTYAKTKLKNKDIELINDILKHIEKEKGPFGHQMNTFIVDNVNNDSKIGTYGFIKNPPAFIGATIENTQTAMVDYGFLFEKVILELTKASIGTVWLGGTFNRKDFNIEVKEKEIIPAVSPVGYQAKKSIREHVIRTMTHAKNRKGFSELFFKNESLTPIKETHTYAKYLKAVQIGPSASNKQPWRILLMDDVFHFYLNRTKGYGENLPIDIQSIDMGIALSHMYLSLAEDELKPEFTNDKPLDVDDLEYVISIKHSKRTN
jgi:hypothetical protein